MFVRRSRLEAAERLIATLQTSLEWMRVMLNKAEQERGALLVKVAGISITTPTIERLAPENPFAKPHPLTEQPAYFEDSGEDASDVGAEAICRDDGTYSYLDHQQLGFE